jgi:ribosomal protein S18 acetylase RimI-like enzyme
MSQFAAPASIVAGLPAPEPAVNLAVQAVAVADGRGWRRARALILDYLEWLAAATGLNPLDTLAELRQELADLPGWYGGPDGALLLATVDGEPAGIVALRAHAEAWAELKRLYVRPAYRGYGLGKRLVRAALVEAERLGCQSVKLATAPGLMDPAVAMYRGLGFRETARFGDLAVDGVLYLERPLQPAARPGARAGARSRVAIGGPA